MNFNVCEISGSHGCVYEDTAFWDITACRLVEVDPLNMVLTLILYRIVNTDSSYVGGPGFESRFEDCPS
jgi:hypothetical protein